MVSELKSSRENICTLIIHHISKKNFLISHIKNIYENVKNSKINQSIFKSSWVPNLAKCMHVRFENNERYDCKTTRWIQKIVQCMWILNINDAWKKIWSKT